MNHSPQKIVVAISTAAILTFGLGACGNVDSPTSPAPAEVPDCDLGDLREGDKDCQNAKAYKKAVDKYGKKKVQEAERRYADKAKELRDKAKSKVPSRPNVPGLNRTTPQSQAKPTKNSRVISPFKARTKRR